MVLTTRPATPADAPAMCDLLNAIIAAGGTTAHKTPFDSDRMINHYIDSPRRLSCTVALEAAELMGFQSLAYADPTWQGPGKLPEDWGIIASFVRMGQQGKGIGGKLFTATKAAAIAAGLRHIDATIRKENTGGIIYYERMGFVDYVETDQTVSKRFDL